MKNCWKLSYLMQYFGLREISFNLLSLTLNLIGIDCILYVTQSEDDFLIEMDLLTNLNLN